MFPHEMEHAITPKRGKDYAPKTYKAEAYRDALADGYKP